LYPEITIGVMAVSEGGPLAAFEAILATEVKGRGLPALGDFYSFKNNAFLNTFQT